MNQPGLIETIVTRIETLTAGVKLFDLRAAGGEPLPQSTAGAHVDVMLPTGEVRQYSLLNASGPCDRYTIAVLREDEGRGGSAWIHDGLAVGDRVMVSAPRSHFELVPGVGHSVFFAGGIGITPLWSMIRTLQAQGRSWELHYSARFRDDAPLYDGIAALAAEGQGRVQGYFTGEGDARLAFDRVMADAGEACFYCCGPGGMIEAFRAAGATYPAERICFEHFAASQDAASDGGYEVELARSGRCLQVEAGETILDALKRGGVTSAYSCREGVCGACETRVLAGTPDHRDAILTEAEREAGETMMICCSGSLGKRLVLDL